MFPREVQSLRSEEPLLIGYLSISVLGGTAAFASAAMLGPRLGRYSEGTDPLPLGNPVNACMGLFVLWWGWLAFNSGKFHAFYESSNSCMGDISHLNNKQKPPGSTYGVSGAKWQYAARAAVMTMMGSFGGGCFSVLYVNRLRIADCCSLIVIFNKIYIGQK